MLSSSLVPQGVPPPPVGQAGIQRRGRTWCSLTLVGFWDLGSSCSRPGLPVPCAPPDCRNVLLGTIRRTFSGSQQDLSLSTISRKQGSQRSSRRLEMPPPPKEVPPGFQEPLERPRWASKKSENNRRRTFKQESEGSA